MPVSSRGPAWPTGMQYPGMHGPGEPCLCPWEETIKKERISPGLTLYHVHSIPVSEVIGSCALSEARWILKFPLTGSRGRITGAGNVEKNSGEWENTLCALPASLKTWKKSERYGSTSKKMEYGPARDAGSALFSPCIRWMRTILTVSGSFSGTMARSACLLYQS